MTNEPEIASGTEGRSAAADWDDAERKKPKEFSGAIDRRVIHDLHRLFKRKAIVREYLLLALGIVGLVLTGFQLQLAQEEPARYGDAFQALAGAGVMFVAWWGFHEGWAIHLDGVVVTGRVHSVGIVVDQLDGRVAWNEYSSAWVSDSAMLLFRSEEERTPRTLGFDGLPLHRSFFRSDDDWDDVLQLLREAVPKVRLVGGR
ncbi:MAG: hypothetical protein HYU52_17815 [Acidobacteria bacterium]|nr:hypothetical protein [Acidobacteriota bacterium]